MTTETTGSLPNTANKAGAEASASGFKAPSASRREIAKVIHDTRMNFCWGKDRNGREPWPEKMPPDFGYVPQPWVDIAWAQASAVMEMMDV